MAQAPPWLYEFCTETLLPVRHKMKGPREPGLPINLGGCAKSGTVMGEWIDGHKHVLDVNIETAQPLIKRTMYTGQLWSMQMQGTNHVSTIIQKVDRNLLLALCEQSRQVLMVKTRLFGLVLDDRHQLPVGDPVLTKAVTFLKEIGIKYAAGEVDRAGLIPMRNAKATSMGLSDTVNVLKKPAASDTT